MRKKKIYVYSLLDGQGNFTDAVVNDPSDNLCIGGYDADGRYHQYDSQSAWYIYGWAEKHGFHADMEEHEIIIEEKQCP